MAGAGPVPPSPPDGSATDLLRARDALLAPPPGARRLAPAALRAALVDLHDLWLATRARALGVGRGSALIAIGSLGRRELAPFSVPDLLLVHDGTRPGPHGIHAVAASLGAPVRAVCTVGEAVEASLADLPTALGLLDARLVAGDAELAERLVGTARRVWRAGAATRADDLVELTHARWRRAGDVAHRVEPDLAAGRGGLRDLTLLDALVTAGTAERPPPEVRAARRMLLDLRTDLHRHAGRARDVLRAEDAHDLAGPQDLRRALGGAGRAVAAATGAALRTLRPPARGPVPASDLGDGVVLHAGEVTLARGASVARDPVLVLRLAAAAARTGRPMAPSALRRLADAAPELRAPWPDAARAALLGLLGSGEGLVEVVEALDRAGLWGRLLPEWGAVRDLPSARRRQVFTVGRHLLETTRWAAAATDRVVRPDLLLLAALVHDLGQGRAEDPVVVGAALAGHVGRRLGLADDDVRLLTAAVRHQDLLPRTAHRCDPDDPGTVHRVLVALDGDPLLLELLHALVEADARGAGPGHWTRWRARLVGDLVARCRPAVRGVPATRR